VHVLSREVKKHITVALSGDGADELFGGYNKHEAWLRLQWPGIKENIVLATKVFWQQFPASREGKWQNRVRQMKRFADAYKLKGTERYLFLASLMSHSAAVEATGYGDASVMECLSNLEISDLNSVLIADQRLVLPNDMLFKVDHASMTHALEVRVPFLDHRVVSLANGLDARLKIHEGKRKRILSHAFSNFLPAEVFQRRKRGFEVPMLSWLTGPMKAELMDTIFSEKNLALQEHVHRAYLTNLQIRLFAKSPGNAAQEAWACFVLDYWLKKYL